MLTSLFTIISALLAVHGTFIARRQTVTPQACRPMLENGPLFIDATCIDPVWSQPIIDNVTDLIDPVSLHLVSGYFNGTATRFNIYLPASEKWEHRFFQYTYPLSIENATAADLGFAGQQGAIWVQTSGRVGFRHSAAAAKFAREVAADYYGVDPFDIYGYIWGGSGGSFQVVGALELSSGVWQGAVPFVQALPTSEPNGGTISALVMLVLRNQSEAIIDAMLFGGDGNPYFDLNEVELAVLLEAQKFGLPLRSWDAFGREVGYRTVTETIPLIKTIDPSYGTDFWSLPGYVGTEQSALGDFFRSQRFIDDLEIASTRIDAEGLVTALYVPSLSSEKDYREVDLSVVNVSGSVVNSLLGTVNASSKTVTLLTPHDAGGLPSGSRIRLDNSFVLGAHLYHRHQISARPNMTIFDQYRDFSGNIPPQRPLLIGELAAGGTTEGAGFTGAINAKVIAVGSLLDQATYPWNSHWYRQQIENSLGDRFENSYRLWYQDNADHLDGPVDPVNRNRLVQFNGVIYQALLDLSAWVERGVSPPSSTSYVVSENQIIVPPKAGQRQGVQPIVELTLADSGLKRIEVVAGTTVRFSGTATVPPGAGQIVKMLWSFEGANEYTQAQLATPGPAVKVCAEYTYHNPGTYYPVLQASAQRNGDTSDQYVLLSNLDRNRVTVYSRDSGST